MPSTTTLRPDRFVDVGTPIAEVASSAQPGMPITSSGTPAPGAIHRAWSIWRGPIWRGSWRPPVSALSLLPALPRDTSEPLGRVLGARPLVARLGQELA